jgi:3-hydroxyisobutyrate dehydrogenase-like beta-hydroxyacid dehydrogenase
VAVIGLGGYGMAGSLLRSGFEVVGYDVAPAPSNASPPTAVGRR